MSRWLVTQDSAQFAVDGLAELRALAERGELGAGDMVQPPGSSDWKYASEIPELAALLGDSIADDDDLPSYRRFGAMAGTATVVMGLLALLVIAGSIGLYLAVQLPGGGTPLIGEGGLSYSQMLVTNDGTPLREAPAADAPTVTILEKDAALDLLAKRGDFYQARTAEGQQGWVPVKSVLPMYLLGGGEVMSEHDPLYNPDRYVIVRNATWLQLDRNNTQLTVFRFMLENVSRYPMTDLVLLATIKDSRGNELERVEIPVEGIVPPDRTTLVGTLMPDTRDGVERSLTEYTFSQLAEKDPDLQLRYSDGVEVEMTTADFTEAQIDLLQLRAIPTTAGR